MAVLTREAILAARDFKVVKVEVPEWGGEVCLRPLSCREKELLQDQLNERRIGENQFLLADIHAEMLSKTICDENGEPLFDAKDVIALGKKSHAVMDRLFAKSREISGISATVEEDEKN